ncbi:hypothetical protein EVAR_47704_1 [Eumeta japonica]|uniref:Uncharacterized protein n=1 Tax=Eumeta variegata TaxID=151549 RepID=A0A4C1XMM5_EUMVA|nr:hypothetical protein EVAR_47704_1 [Eumeta japonica]
MQPTLTLESPPSEHPQYRLKTMHCKSSKTQSQTCAGDPLESRRLPPTMGTRYRRGINSALPAFWEGIE